MTLTFKIGLFCLGLYILILIISYGAIIINNMTIKELSNEDNHSLGGWHGGTFFANPPLIIDNFSEHKDIIKAINKHNFAVKCFWANFLILGIGLFILNL
jgi:hypothetical protein